MTDDIEAADIADIVLADVPHPIGATKLDPWMQWHKGGWMRYFTIKTLTEGRVTVHASGWQNQDGETDYFVTLGGGDIEYTRDELDVLATLIGRAAEVIDQATGDSPPWM